MVMTPGVDHVDLLVTAGDRWGVLVYDVVQVPEVGAVDRVSVATLQSAGAALVHALTVAAERAQVPADAGHRLAGYRFEPVPVLEPVEVLKAAHAVEATAGQVPGWVGSVAQRLVAGVARAAAERVDGYEVAPWVWTRPATRSGIPAGFGRGWRPELPGLQWVEDVDELEQRWQQAALIVVTAEAAADLPVHLPRRGGVFVLAERAPDDATWSEIVDLVPEAVLFWPGNLTWLMEQLRAPAAAFTQYRDDELADGAGVAVGAGSYGATKA